ncbi:MAG: nickel ABC transporter ATP-binding protein [Chloroflexi bacterium CG15_BIG_FIL_POST_REV_8_21_14_020_46_15]|nr:MAG: nickel ABC transporter ATP-binding protein [Chloroflexi bacterium CG15_BIG_FIL_POST_REV_8_21_14_020_46_15]
MDRVIFKLENVDFEYEGDIIGVSNINLEIEKGDTVAILGPNGSGKSTLLKILDGLYPPKKGKLYAFDEEISQKRLRDKAFNKFFRRNIALLFQDADVQLFCPTVEDEIAFGLRQLGLSQKVIEEKVERVMRSLNIQELRGRYPYSLSGGEKKKVAIASILSLDSEVYLLDEPTANLDPQTEGILINQVVSLQKEGKTLIIATQDMLLAEHVAYHVLLMDQNKKAIAFGSKESIFSNLDLFYKLGLLHGHQAIHEFTQSYIHSHRTLQAS